MFNLSTADAAILLTIVSGLTAGVVAWLRTLAWPEWVKFLVAVVFSGIAGALSAYIGGGIQTGSSILTNLAVVYTAGRVFYFGAFQALGLERILLPKAALATIVRAQGDQAVSEYTNDQAKDVVNPATASTITVDTKITPNLVNLRS